MGEERRSFLADFTDPGKIEFMAHLTPEQHRAWVALMAKAEMRGYKRLQAYLRLYLRTTRSIMYRPARVGSEQEVEVLKQHQEAVERVDDPPEEFERSGLFGNNTRKRRKVVVDGETNS